MVCLELLLGRILRVDDDMSAWFRGVQVGVVRSRVMEPISGLALALLRMSMDCFEASARFVIERH